MPYRLQLIKGAEETCKDHLASDTQTMMLSDYCTKMPADIDSYSLIDARL